jgi:hypothetical protein
MQDEQWMDLALEAGLLRATMAQRAPVEQARGIVMARRRVGADAALVLLRAAAERDGSTLEELSAAVIRLVAHGPVEVGGSPAAADLLTGDDPTYDPTSDPTGDLTGDLPQCGLAEPSS